MNSGPAGISIRKASINFPSPSFPYLPYPEIAGVKPEGESQKLEVRAVLKNPAVLLLPFRSFVNHYPDLTRFPANFRFCSSFAVSLRQEAASSPRSKKRRGLEPPMELLFKEASITWGIFPSV